MKTTSPKKSARAGAKPKPPQLDVESFQQLLAAAYVIQEQSGQAPEIELKPTPADSVAEVVETREQIQTRQMDLKSAAPIILERLQRITGASGAALGVVKGDQFTYAVATGNTSSAGGSQPLESSLVLPAGSLRDCQVVRSADAANDPKLNSQICRDLGIKSLLAVPVRHDGRVAAVLELRFARANAFQEHDVRIAQLMAALAGEVMARDADLEWKQALATERDLMLEALERIKPQIDRLAGGSSATTSDVQPTEATSVPDFVIPFDAAETSRPVTQVADFAAADARPEDSDLANDVPANVDLVTPDPIRREPTNESACRNCGRQFRAEEFFCGSCGTARITDDSTRSDLQSKWASLWYRQQAADRNSVDEPKPDFTASRMTDSNMPMSSALEEIAAQFSDDVDMRTPAAPVTEPTEPGQTALRRPFEPEHHLDASPWGSAAKAREWLDSLQGPRQVLRRQKANIYLGTAAVLLLIVITGWGTRSAPDSAPANSTTASVQHKSPDANLTLFEKLLVSMGLAEAPAAPPNLGNPDARVWVDLHTALYYCSGTDLYGKTPDGKFTTQRDAQLDQFEPAYRKACD